MGFAVDAASGDKELTGVFAALYALGCLGAVLAVRQVAVFTSVIQPPLILFVMVPGAYYLMHASDIHGIKDILINCGYPLIERFPLMFFTSAAVLLIGAVRWYRGASSRQGTPAEQGQSTGGGIAQMLTALLGTGSEAEERQRRRHSVDRRPGNTPKSAGDPAARAARGGRPVKRTGAPSRSRHARPPESEIARPTMDDHRPRPPRTRRPRPDDPMPPAEPRRRPRPPLDREPGRAVPPRERRPAYDRADRRDRPPPRRRYEDYEPLEPHRQRGTGSHHPVSRVRYRGADGSDDRPDHRRRGQRSGGADRWEYDI